VARILTVDDQLHMTCVMARWLGRQGHTVVRAENGKVALELLRAEPIDILVTDVDMPEMDGLTLAGHSDVGQQLRAVILVTGRPDYKELRVRCRAEVHVLPKPFSPDRLTHLIGEILQRESPQDGRRTRRLKAAHDSPGSLCLAAAT
jgi:DNA-binding NtrC family response regulator